MAGTGDGGPPRTPDERARRERRQIVLATAAGVVLAVPTLLFSVQAVDVVRGVDLGGGSTSSQDADGGPGATPDRDVEVPTLDLDALEGRDAVFGTLLDAVDRSERAMIDAQEAIASAFLDAGPDGDAALEGAGEAAGDGQRTLQELRTDVAQPVEDDDARELRDRYLTHLDAWVRYLVAVEADPQVLVDAAAQAPLIERIDTSGEAFAERLRDLPDDVGDEVRAVADAIAQRGFPEGRGDAEAVRTAAR